MAWTNRGAINAVNFTMIKGRSGIFVAGVGVDRGSSINHWKSRRSAIGIAKGSGRAPKGGPAFRARVQPVMRLRMTIGECQIDRAIVIGGR
jgi:hypothetical protein